MIASVFLCCLALAPVPEVKVDHDNVVVRESCRVLIPAGTVIEDADNNGVIQIEADGITVEFVDGSTLVGNANLNDRDELSGVGIRLHGHRGVTIKNASIRGYKLGIWADDTQGLTIDHANIKTMWCRRLLSTPEAEDSSDWLYPHHNDEKPWREEYGGAVVIERSREPVIHNVTVREGQNGIILDRVFGAQIYDNDCSFLSGWGLAMWRSNNNIVSRNAFDFCIRGYSHGVYNRGQDAAGILIFEQCSNNTIALNSITHGGDGVFGFAGREAIGEVQTPGLKYDGLGCNDNLFFGNDLSFAAAHGLEMTFSHRNVIRSNTFEDNSICGIWGGYSQDTLIAFNTFDRNGSDGYGLERGAINIEHGAGNRILANQFKNNEVAVHLWWDNDGKLLEFPGVKSTYRGVADNEVALNQSTDDKVFLRVRDEKDGGHVTNLTVVDNQIERVGKELELSPGIKLNTASTQQLPKSLQPPHTKGNSRPVGARPLLRGRDRIIMTQWGAWDHAAPLVQVRPYGTESVIIDVLEAAGVAANESKPRQPQIKTTGEISLLHDAEDPHRLIVTPKQDSVLTPYSIDASFGSSSDSRVGVLLKTNWDVTLFSWDKQTDPRENLKGWHDLAASTKAIKSKASAIDFKFGSRGPGAVKLVSGDEAKTLGNDHFGLIARTKITIPKGDWKFTTTSDDGVRVSLNGKQLIENWTWHAPTKNDAIFHQENASQVDLEIEYFEIDGFATLQLEIQQAQN